MRRLVRDPWFQNKAIGWGLAPASWQGWAATGAYCMVIVGAAALLPHHGGLIPFLIVLALLTPAYIALAILTSVWLPPR